MKTLSTALLLGILACASEAAVFWRDPGPVNSLDLAGGPGGAAKAPKPPFTFVSEEKGGTTAKVSVKDDNGVPWIVKFGEEVKAENFASRIVWAAGYFAAPTYFVPTGKIEGVSELGRASAFVKNGTFRDARFQLRDDKLYESAGKWNLDDSDIKGSRELAGYKLLMILLASWDMKPDNLAVLNVNGTKVHAVTDWGATMGRAGEISGRSKWDCGLYTSDTSHLIEGVENGFVLFNFQGKQGQQVARNIRVEDVSWLMGRLGKLSDAQIGAALKASGATEQEASCFGQAFRNRLNQLSNLAKPVAPGTSTIRTTTTETKTIRTQD